MAAQPIKLRCTFVLQCYTYEGIEAIKASLIEAKKQTNSESEADKIIFQLIASPDYKAEVVTLDKTGGIKRLENALSIIQTEIKSRGGIFKLLQGPTRIGTRIDDVDNDDILARQQNMEDEDDTSEEESNEEGMDIDLEDNDIQ